MNHETNRYTITFANSDQSRTFKINLDFDNGFEPNDQKEIYEHPVMQIVLKRLCEVIMPWVPIVNAKSDMLKAGISEEDFSLLGIEDAIYPVTHGLHSEMNVLIK